MWLLLICLLVYCGLGLIIHENKYKQPTARFKRGLKRSTSLQFVVFVLAWITIIFSPRINDRWARLSYITWPPYPVATGAAVVALFAVLILGAYKLSSRWELPESLPGEGLIHDRTGQVSAAAEAEPLSGTGLSPIARVSSADPEKSEWISIAQAVPVPIDGMKDLLNTGVGLVDIDKIMREFAGAAGGYPEASIRLFTPADLENRTRRELRVMRNEIFARHSYIFTSNEMRDYFGKKPWYTPRYSSVASRFNEFERANIDIISEYELKVD